LRQNIIKPIRMLFRVGGKSNQGSNKTELRFHEPLVLHS